MIFISTQQNHSSPLCLTQVEDADRWLLKREADSIFGCCWFFQISSASWDNSSLRWWGWCWGGSQPTCKRVPAKLPVTKHRYQQHSLPRVSCLLTAKEDGGRGGSQPMSVRRHSWLTYPYNSAENQQESSVTTYILSRILYEEHYCIELVN